MPHFAATIIKVGVLRSVLVPPTIVAALGREPHIPVLACHAGANNPSAFNPAGGTKRRLVL